MLTGAPWESRTGWAAQNWSPCVGVEHIATRERVAMFDITPFAKFDITGADALSFLERICANRIDRPVGTVVYTSMLTPSGGIRCDLTVTRKDEDRFRVVTGGGSGQHDRAWLLAQRREGERVEPHGPHRLALRARPLGAEARATSSRPSPTSTSRTTRSRT